MQKSNYNFKEKKVFIIENWFFYSIPEEEKENVLKKLPNDVDKNYVMEDDENILVNFDYDKIAPFVRYCLWNVARSMEYNAIKVNFIFIISTLVLTFLTFLFLFIRTWPIESELLEIKESLVIIEEKKCTWSTWWGFIMPDNTIDNIQETEENKIDWFIKDNEKIEIGKGSWVFNINNIR